MTHSAILVTVLYTTACAPNLPSEDWLVTSARVIAVKGEAPEGKPGAPATYTAFVADPNLGAPRAVVRFGWCVAPKALTDNAVVSSACLDANALQPIAVSAEVTASTPFNACSLFGPIAPPGGLRARDPDGSGGFYQPLRVDLPGAEPTFHLARIACGVANASAELTEEFTSMYVLNRNPHIASLVVLTDEHKVAPTNLLPDSHVELEVSWTAEDAESFVIGNAASGVLVPAREAMQVAWYVTAGKLDTESTARDSDDHTLTTSNAWTAPVEPTTARLWVVLRDSRGGVDVMERDLSVFAGE